MMLDSEYFVFQRAILIIKDGGELIYFCSLPIVYGINMSSATK
jgi:hypothetical protein